MFAVSFFPLTIILCYLLLIDFLVLYAFHISQIIIIIIIIIIMAATRKCQKYSELSLAYRFLPIAVETLGPTNDSAYEFFKILGHKITDVSGDSRKVLLF